MTDQVDYTFNVDMSPVQDFEDGLSMNFDVKTGNEAAALIESHPDYFKTNPLTFGVEIAVKNQETGGLIMQTLENLKGMLFAIPKIEALINMGLQISTRQSEASVFVDVSLGGALAEQAGVGLSLLSSYMVNGKCTCDLISGFRPIEALTHSFEQTLQKICQFKVKLNSHFSCEKGTLETFYGSLAGVLSKLPSLPPNANKLTILLNALTIIKDMKYEYKYDTQDFLNGVIEIIKLSKPDYQGDLIQEISGKVAEGQMMATMGIEQGKMMAGMFLAPFAEAIKAANFDKITLFGYMSETKILYNIQLNLPGVDSYLNENILSSL
jgi:hypothetical protein